MLQELIIIYFKFSFLFHHINFIVQIPHNTIIIATDLILFQFPLFFLTFQFELQFILVFPLILK